MTFAWYGHLKFREMPLYKVVVVSWLIAFFEYCFQVPANHIGSYGFSAVQLKTTQEVITLVVFSVFRCLFGAVAQVELRGRLWTDLLRGLRDLQAVAIGRKSSVYAITCAVPPSYSTTLPAALCSRRR